MFGLSVVFLIILVVFILFCDDSEWYVHMISVSCLPVTYDKTEWPMDYAFVNPLRLKISDILRWHHHYSSTHSHFQSYYIFKCNDYFFGLKCIFFPPLSWLDLNIGMKGKKKENGSSIYPYESKWKDYLQDISERNNESKFWAAGSMCFSCTIIKLIQIPYQRKFEYQLAGLHSNGK